MARHYLDHASTSPPRPEVAAAIADWLRAAPEHTGDPGRVHADGRTVRAVIEAARDEVAALFGVRPRQVIFTSGGTEAVNAATWSATRARPGAPVVCAEVEHSAARDASARAGAVAVAPCDRLGRVHAEAVADVLGALEDRGTPAALVHCQLANHEVGTVQPVGEVVEVARRFGAAVHVDACAAAGQVPLAVDELGADYVSVSAHKLGGPPGAGALIVRRNLRVEPFVVGGEQERARRGGMENVPGIVGFGAAAGALAGPGRLEGEAAAARRRRDALAAAASAVAGVEVLGDPDGRLPHIACLGVGGVEAEPVLLGLDQAGISAHSGSACSSESLAPSPVLAAMGADAERSLRLSVGWSSTDADVEAFAAAFPGVVSALRALRG
ncbi:MAG TPA: aminotransferase class V-fold PLP-dependent enzyme [Acidimicrobiales bacterium]|nr:aminotransferase class V-fold PLP-dependent enzyme [Acidimicrobiales bacterium]